MHNSLKNNFIMNVDEKICVAQDNQHTHINYNARILSYGVMKHHDAGAFRKQTNGRAKAS
jgi:hypothetical protein